MRVELSRLFCKIALCTAFAASASERVVLQTPLLFEPNPAIPEVARLECGGMAEHIGKPIFQTIRDQIPDSRQADGQSPAAEDTVLRLLISDLRGVAADGIQGSWQKIVPAITIRAELYLDSRLIVSKMFRRGASIFSGPDVCEVTKRIAAQLGKDLAAWLPGAIQGASTTGKEPETRENPSASGESRLLVHVPVLFEPGSAILESAKSECDVAQKVGTSVFRNVKRRFTDARPIDELSKSGDSHVLKVTITALESVRAGSENAGRSVTLRADLVQDAKVVATHTFKLESARSLTPCLNVDHIARLLGQDLINWLQPAFFNSRAATTK